MPLPRISREAGHQNNPASSSAELGIGKPLHLVLCQRRKEELRDRRKERTGGRNQPQLPQGSQSLLGRSDDFLENEAQEGEQ